MIAGSGQNYLRRLRSILLQQFDEDGLRALCVELGLIYNDLFGVDRGSKITTLLNDLARNKRLPDLLRVARAARPDYKWPDVPEGYTWTPLLPGVITTIPPYRRPDEDPIPKILSIEKKWTVHVPPIDRVWAEKNSALYRRQLFGQTKFPWSTPVEKLRLDAAVPEEVKVHESFELAVAICQPSSPILNEQMLTKVGSGEVQVLWPKSTPYIRLRVQVSAPACQILESDERAFRLYRKQDSPVIFFHLVPQRPGDIGIIVTVFQEEDCLGASRLHTVARERMAGTLRLEVTSKPVSRQSAEIDIIARATLRKKIVSHFMLGDLKVLAFDMGINYDNLEGSTLDEKSVSLIDYCQLRGLLPDLKTQLRERRPQVSW